MKISSIIKAHRLRIHILFLFILIGLIITYSGCTHQPLVPVIVNTPPTIQQFQAVPQHVPLGQVSFLYVNAQDAQGDTLQFEWKPASGTILGQGNLVQWIAPSVPGEVPVQVTVSDGHGGVVSESFTVTVISRDSTNRKPRIVAIKADSSTIKGGHSTRIRAQAEDADGDALTYFWIASAGEIQPEGAQTLWIAPNTRDQFRNQEITVFVTDNRGGVDFGTIIIPVEPPYPLPVIDSLSAHPIQMFLGGKTTIRVKAHNPDGQPLQYYWRASGGQFLGKINPTDSVVVWQAPSGPVCCAPGPYQIYVTVRNEAGGETEMFTVVQVVLKEGQQ